MPPQPCSQPASAIHRESPVAQVGAFWPLPAEYDLDLPLPLPPMPFDPFLPFLPQVPSMFARMTKEENRMDTMSDHTLLSHSALKRHHFVKTIEHPHVLRKCSSNEIEIASLPTIRHLGTMNPATNLSLHREMNNSSLKTTLKIMHTTMLVQPYNMQRKSDDTNMLLDSTAGYSVS